MPQGFHLCCPLLIILFQAPIALPQSTTSDIPVGIVAGKPIFEQDLLTVSGVQLHQLQVQEYDLKKRALDNLIAQRLLEDDAAKKGVSVQKLLEQEADSKVDEPGEAELKAFYLGQDDRLKQSFEEVKAQLKSTLMKAKVQEARRAYVHKLSKAANVVVLLSPPKTEVAQNPARLRGSPGAPVKIVEFSDFQCPYCRQAADTLKQVLAKYEGKVNLSYLDFPLRSLHPQAQASAEAARCAGEQGRFWEYHDHLFEDQPRLDPQGLRASAADVGADLAKFDACIQSGKFKGAIEQDLQQGVRAGVGATPGFFINGIFLSGAPNAATLERIIDEQLASVSRPAGSSFTTSPSGPSAR